MDLHSLIDYQLDIINHNFQLYQKLHLCFKFLPHWCNNEAFKHVYIYIKIYNIC